MMKQKNFVYELAEYVSNWEPWLREVAIKHFEGMFNDIPEECKPMAYIALTKDIKDIPEYI